MKEEKQALVAHPIAGDFGVSIDRSHNPDLLGLDMEEVFDLCRTRGVVLFSGYDLDIEAFQEFTNRFSLDWMSYEGGAHERKILNPQGDGTIYSVNFYLGQKKQLTFELPLHADMSYLKHSPVILFFYSVMPARTGGQTMLCDGLQIYRELSEPTRRLFRSKRIKYIRKYPPGNWQGRFGTEDLEEVKAFCQKNELKLSIDGTGTLTTEYLVSAVPQSRWGGHTVFRNSILPVVRQEEVGKDDSLVRFEDGSPLPREVIEELREVTRRLTVLLPLKLHEFLFVDNSRVLHGRKAFDDPEREVAIRMCGSVTW